MSFCYSGRRNLEALLVNFTDEIASGLSLCVGDIHETNFIVDGVGRIYAICFGCIGFLPPSFTALALDHASNFANKMSAQIEYPISSVSANCVAMDIVAGLFVICGSSSYGERW